MFYRRSKPLNITNFATNLIEDIMYYSSVGIYNYHYHREVVPPFHDQNDSKYYHQLTVIR